MEGATQAAIDLLLAVHIVTAVLLAWPFYALVAVNQRARLGPPLGDRADLYLENTIKGRVLPCYVFQATALVSGLLLVGLHGLGLGSLVDNPALGIKSVLLIALAVLLTYVVRFIQPRIDELFQALAQGGSPEIAASIGRLRLQRKRIAATCLFMVLTIVILGVQAWEPFPLWLNGLLIASAALFSWRSYGSQMRLGWF